jgi:hypothetical protein
MIFSGCATSTILRMILSGSSWSIISRAPLSLHHAIVWQDARQDKESRPPVVGLGSFFQMGLPLNLPREPSFSQPLQVRLNMDSFCNQCAGNMPPFRPASGIIAAP